MSKTILRGELSGYGYVPPDVEIFSGSGSPEGVVTASAGCLYLNTDGGTNTTMWVKESGSGATGWTAK